MTDLAEELYRQHRSAHWDKVAQAQDHRHGWGNYYHRRLISIFQSLVPPGQRVLELGSGQGDLLAALRPSRGVGIDFSAAMVSKARERHPQLSFLHADVHQLAMEDTYDYILLSDLVNDLWDVERVFRQIHQAAGPHSRVIINTYSRLWEFPLWLAKRAGLARPVLFQNWLTVDDIRGMLYLSGFEVIRHWEEILWPLATPIVAPFLNRFAAKLWPCKWFDLTHLIVARPSPTGRAVTEAPMVSVIVPARNESGNIRPIFERVPEMGRGTELIFVEGASTDDTFGQIEKALKEYPGRRARLYRQTGRGKGDAVRLGFSKARGDMLMILDADLTVPPEDLPRFYNVLVTGKGEFANGVRLVYPMEKEAMRFANLVGNKFFSLAFTWLLGQPVKDSLCGTKVLWKRDYERIAANRQYFGEFDPFGDFDLLFGAAKLNMKICDVPIRYRDRQYGTTNIQRWRHGWLLLRMVVYASRKLKFI
jgi:SAM-dependent methyltransferase